MYELSGIEVKGMLLQFKFSNFRCFAEETVFDMTATSIKEHKYSLIEANGVNVLPVSAVYGANASGKSSFFMAMERMRSVIVDRLSTSDNNSKPFSTPFMFDEGIQKSPANYEVSLLIGSYEYRYGFSCTNHKILYEYLFKKKLSKNKTIEKLIFERDINKSPKDVSIGPNINKKIRSEIEHCASMATDKTLLLSDVGLRGEEKELFSVFSWFLGLQVLLNDLQEGITSQNICERLVGETLFGNDHIKMDLKQNYISLVHDIDPSITDIVNCPELDSDGNNINRAKTIHVVNGKKIPVPFSVESDGTNKILCIALFLLDSIKRGRTIFVDELDSKLHPLLLRKIVQMFTNKKINPNGAQLIFSAHNIINLDSSDLRRDEIWFVEKEDHKSTMYSLFDFDDGDGGVRSDLSYGKHYLSGRFGAVPFQNEE